MKTLEELKKIVRDLKETAVTKEKAMEVLKVALSKAADTGGRRTGFALGGDLLGVGPMWFTKSGGNATELEFQKRADDLYILGTILKVNPRQTHLFSTYAKDEEFVKAMDSVEMADWVPTQLSARLQEKIELALKVAALHDRIPMPTDPYNLPYVAGQTTAYLAGESTDEDSPRFKKSKMSAGKVTFNAKKIASRVILTEELIEESIIPVLPLLKKDIVKAIARAIEDATVNGDNAGAHQDADVVAAEDARKAWMGYRQLAQATLDFGGALTSTKLRTLRGLMGVYGVDPNELALVCSIGGYLKLVDLSEVKTIDVYGPKATIITGELAKFDAIPIIVSEKCRDDLDNTGVYSAPGQILTQLLLVYRDAVLFGDRRNVTVKTDFDIERDQNILVATQRLAFSNVFASTETFIGRGYNCPKI